MRKNKLYTPIIALLIIASLAAIGPTSAQVSNSVYVDPATTEGAVGDPVSISIMAFEVSGVNSYEIRLDFNTVVLDVTSAVVGDFITGAVLPFVTIDELGGKVTIGVLNLDPLQEVSGSGVLGTIDFTVAAEGSSVLDIGLYNSGPGEPHNWLLDTASLQIPHESFNGQFGPPPPPTGTLTISTTPVEGEIFVDGVSVGFGTYSAVVYVGDYTVTFGPVAGYVTPGAQVATVNEGMTTEVVGLYQEEALTGFLDISTTPVAGEIFVDGVSVGTTGSYYAEVGVGDYTISFGPVTGYETPDPQLVTVLAGETTYVVGTYIEIPPPPTYLARLVGKSAWPEHHHYTAKDEDNIQTLFAKVRNIGELTTTVKVKFVIDTPNAFDEVITTEIEIDPAVNRGIGYVQADYIPWIMGKHYVTATCLYWDPTIGETGDWVESTIKVKTFSFAVASLK